MQWTWNHVCLIGLTVFLLILGPACGSKEKADSSSTSETKEVAGEIEGTIEEGEAEPEGDMIADILNSESDELEEDAAGTEEEVFSVEPAHLPPINARRPAPGFTLSDLSGNQVSLSDYRGKVVILDFWATWCPPCRMEIPHFIDLQNQYRSKGVEIVGIAMDRDGIKAVLPFVQKQNVNYVSLIGTGKVTSDYGGVRSIPTTFVIDQEGRIVTQHVGFTERKVFESEIVALLQEG